MARITAADCVSKVSSRFELVAISAQLTKDIQSGMHIPIDKGRDKDHVVALRLIAGDFVDCEVIKEELTARLQNKRHVDVVDSENVHTEGSEGEDLGFEDMEEYVLGAGDLSLVSDDFTDVDEDELSSGMNDDE